MTQESGTRVPCRPWQPWSAFAAGLFLPSGAHLFFMAVVDGQGLDPELVFFSLGYGLILTLPATLLGALGVWLLGKKGRVGLPQILAVAVASGLFIFLLFDRLFVSEFGAGESDSEGYILALGYSLIAGSAVWGLLRPFEARAQDEEG